MSEQAWAAGFFEGEGSVYIVKNRGVGRWGQPSPGSLTLSVSQSYHTYTLERFRKAVDCATLRIYDKQGTHVKQDGTISTIYRIDFCGWYANHAMEAMADYLSLECAKYARWQKWKQAGGLENMYDRQIKEDRQS